MGAQRLACDQLHRPPKLFFQQKRGGHKVVERFFVRRELDEEIYVALRIGCIAPKRAKQADASDAQLTQIVPVAAQTSNQILFGLNCSHSNKKPLPTSDVATQHNDEAQLKWARKGSTEFDTTNRHRPAKFPFAGIGTLGRRRRTRLVDLA